MYVAFNFIACCHLEITKTDIASSVVSINKSQKEITGSTAYTATYMPMELVLTSDCEL
jgi:hypothetical protein